MASGIAITMRVIDSRFDASKILRAKERTERRVGIKAGAFVRRTAKTSIRKRKRVSSPGQPPSSHTGALRKLLLFGYDAGSKTTVVGFKPTRSGGSIPQALEKGGTTRSSRRSGRKPIRVAARPSLVPALDKERPKLPGRWANSVRA